MARVEEFRIIGLSREGKLELRRLQKIERAARALVEQISPVQIEQSRELRKNYPGSCGDLSITHARLCNLVDALAPGPQE